MAYQMIFSDMDGTLLEDDIHVSKENQEAVQAAIEKGVGVVLCTGRGVFGTKAVLRTLGMVGKKGFVISQNGGCVYHLENMELAWKKGFSPKKLAPYAKMAEEMGLEVYFYDDQKFMATHMTQEVRNYCDVMTTEAIILTDYENYDGVFTKSLFNGDREKLLVVQKKIMEEMGEEFAVFFSSDHFMEVVRLGVNKGSAMKQVLDLMEIPVSDAIAIGDSENDISMITQAGLGVAVANAMEHVKTEADYVTERDFKNSAVAEVIEKFVLHK